MLSTIYNDYLKEADQEDDEGQKLAKRYNMLATIYNDYLKQATGEDQSRYDNTFRRPFAYYVMLTGASSGP